MRLIAYATNLQRVETASSLCGDPFPTGIAVSRSERSRPWKTVRSIVADNQSVLGTLVRRADKLGRCEESLKGYLDLPAAESLRIAAFEGGTLVVIVDSAARGARLRFLAPRIVAHAARLLGRTDLERLEIRVRPAR